ncbi:MAG: NusG domain II-containing protein [Spirochaetes bacterium]|nr:NusG domain II-containing protein [Spirochaetota bacterium]
MTVKKKRTRLRPGDCAIVAIAVSLIVVFSCRYFFASSGGARIEITAPSYDDSFSLEENRVVDVSGPLGITRVVIRDGEVWVSESPCKQKICVKMGHKHRVGDQIICIPNRVLVEIVGKGEQVDGIAR